MKIDKENKVLELTDAEFKDKENWTKYFAQNWRIKLYNKEGKLVMTTGPMNVPMTFEEEEVIEFINKNIDAMFKYPAMYGSSAMVESIFITHMQYYDFAKYGPWSAPKKSTFEKYRDFSIKKKSGALGLSSLHPDVNDFVEILKEFREEHMKT